MAGMTKKTNKKTNYKVNFKLFKFFIPFEILIQNYVIKGYTIIMNKLKGLLLGISALALGVSGMCFASSNILSAPTSKEEIVETYVSNPAQPATEEITSYEIKNYLVYIQELIDAGNEPALSGSGTVDNPYKISTAQELAWLSYKHFQATAFYKTGAYYVLTNDIVLNDETFNSDGTISGGDGVVYEWEGIGGNFVGDWNSAFRGNLDGQGYTISGLYQNTQDKYRGGLFGYVHGSRAIKNINIENAYINRGVNTKGTSLTGAFIGNITGGTSALIQNCHFKGYVGTSGNIVGGIIGQSSQITIKECTVDATIEGSSYVAGITAYADQVTIQNCKVNSNVAGSVYGAGIAGLLQIDSLVENCYVRGRISGRGDLGGVVATLRSNSLIKKSINYAEVCGTSAAVGGITGGFSASTIDRCQNYGKVTTESGYALGGISGGASASFAETHIKNCENHGKVISTKNTTALAGIVGQIFGTSGAYMFIKNCKNYADISCVSSGHAAGIVGIGQERLTIDNCYNSGKISAPFGRGVIAGTLSGQEEMWSPHTIITNCSADMENGIPLIAGTQKIDILTIKNCKINYKTSNLSYAIVGAFEQVSTKTYIENIEINYTTETTTNLRLFSKIKGELTVKNVILNIICENYSISTGHIYSSFDTNADITYNGIIITANNLGTSKKKYYYGENFSNIYVSWKTGKIGLISIDGRGNFQGEVNEDVLIKKGYTKIAL